jgi:hypothetical protein
MQSSIPPIRYQVWRDKDRCSHYESDYRITKIRHISVPGPGTVLDFAAKPLTFIAPLVGAIPFDDVIDKMKNPTHDAIEIFYECDKVIDNLLRDILTLMINISNASLHTSSEYTQNERYYHLSEYQDNVKSNYLLHSCSLQLCDALIYYANILKNKNINN